MELKKSRCISQKLTTTLVGVIVLLACALDASATSGTWNGTSSTAWSLSGNWSTSPVPGTGDTATFNNAGNANTTLDLGGGVTIRTNLFDTANAAAYTIGSGAVGSQTLTLDNGTAAITLNSAVANNQLFNANLVLGTAIASTTTVSNSSASTLTIAGSIRGGTGGTAAAKTLILAGSGPITIGGAIGNGGATSLAFTKTGSGTVTLSGLNTNTGTTTVSGGTLNLAAGAAITNLPTITGGSVINVPATMTNSGTIIINGTGSDARFNIGSGADLIGTFNMGGGTLTENTAVRIGSEPATGGINPGNGTFNLSGGTVTALSFWQVGRNFGAGTMNMTGGTFIKGSVNYFVVANSGASSTFNMSGGSIIATGQVLVAFGGGSVGVWNLSGSANVDIKGTSRFAIGLGGNGTLNQTGGTLAYTNTTAAEIGALSTTLGTGLWRMSGGNAAIATPLWLGDGANCTGTFTLTNAAAMNVASIVFGTNAASASGTLNLDGGTLTVANGIRKGQGSGTVNFNGGTLVSSASSTAFLTGLTTANVLVGGAVIDTTNNSITISQNLLDGDGLGGGLTKLGTGTLLLNGTHTYTGPTLVNGGVLGGVCAIPGSVTVATSCGLAPGSSTVGTMTVGSLALNGTTANLYKFNLTTNDLVVVSGGLTLGASTKFGLQEEGTSLPYSAVGTFKLIQYGGADPSLDATWTTASASNPHISNPTVGYTYQFAASGGSLTLTIGAAANVGSWGVDSDGNWSVAGNWTGSSGTMPPRVAGDTAIFGTGSSLRTVTLDTNETVGVITMTNANSFVVTGGNTLKLDRSGSGATITVSDGSANAIQTGIALNDNLAVSVSSGKSLSLSGSVTNVSGAKTLSVTGGGTLALSGNNSYGPAAGSVGTTVGGGILQLGSSTALGAGEVTNTGSFTVQSVAPNVSVTNNFGTLASTTFSVGNNSTNNLSLAGAISGGAALTKVGTNMVTLGGINTYNGDTTVSAGTLSVAAAAAISPPVNATLVVGSVSNLPAMMTNAGTLSVNSSGNGFNIGSGHDLIGTFNMAGGSLVCNSACRIGSEPTTGGINPGSGTFNLSGGTVTALTFWQVSRNYGAGTMNMTGGTFIKGSGNYFVVANSGANGTFNMSGGSLIATGQVLVAYANGTAGSTGVWNLSGSANVDIKGASRFAIGLGGIGTLNQTGGTLTYTNTAAAEIGAFSTFAGTGLWDMSGGTATLTNRLFIGDGASSAGTLNLSGAANMSVGGIQLGVSTGAGALNLNGGTLTANGDITNGSGSGTLNFNGGTLKAGVSSATFMTNLTAANVLAGGAIIDSDTNAITIGQPLLDSGGGLTKLGSGTLTLSGANTYIGATTVSNGTLVVNGSLAGPVTVNAGATLAGSGTVNGAVTVNGTVAPGASIGALTFGTAPTLNGTITAEINRTNSPNADKVVVSSGTLNFGGTLTVVNIDGMLQNGDTFDLFDGALSGSFATLNFPGGQIHWNTSDLNVGGTLIFTNAVPVAQNLTLGVVRGGSVSFTVIGGKNEPTDADGDSMAVTGVSAASSGTSGYTATSVTYIADGAEGTNTFTYTVTDALGATDTKAVTVVVSDPQGFNLLSATAQSGNAYLTYLGIPGSNYALDVTHALPATNWVPVITNTAAANGYLNFTNPISMTPTNDYYRTRYVP